MKNVNMTLASLALATAGISTTAQAQQTPGTQQDIQSKVATTVGVTRLGNQDAVSLWAIAGQDAVMVHIDGAVSEKDRAFLVSIGVALGEGGKAGFLIATASQYQALLSEYWQRVSANTAGIKWVVNDPFPGINTASFEVKHGSGTDKHLRDDTKKYNFTVEDVLQTQSSIPGGTRYTTQKKRTRTDVTEVTSHDYIGGDVTSATLSATGKVGTHTTLTGSATHTQTHIPGEAWVSTMSAALSAKYHMPESQANVSAGIATGRVVALGFQKKVSNALVFGATISGTSQKNIWAYAGVTYYLGGDAPNPGQIANTTRRKMQDDMLATSAASYAVNPMSVGKIETKMMRDEKKTVTVENDSQDVLDPVKPPEGKDNPTTTQLDVTGITTNSANLLCNLVDLDGVTGTCTVIDLDSNNSVVYSGPINPQLMALTLKPDRNYHAQVSGTAQKKNPDNTLTAVPVNQIKNFKTNVEVAPDPAPTSAPIGTITIGDNGGMPTSYTLPAVVDSVWRVVSCTIWGLPTGFTLASDNRTLNIVADVGGPTPFSGSRTCDAWAPWNPLVQPINWILNDE